MDLTNIKKIIYGNNNLIKKCYMDYNKVFDINKELYPIHINKKFNINLINPDSPKFSKLIYIYLIWRLYKYNRLLTNIGLPKINMFNDSKTMSSNDWISTKINQGSTVNEEGITELILHSHGDNLYKDIFVYAGEEYNISFEIRLFLFATTSIILDSDGDTETFNVYRKDFNVPQGEWTKIDLSFKAKKDGILKVRVNLNLMDSFELRKPKLEIGSKSTEYNTSLYDRGINVPSVLSYFKFRNYLFLIKFINNINPEVLKEIKDMLYKTDISNILSDTSFFTEPTTTTNSYGDIYTDHFIPLKNTEEKVKYFINNIKIDGSNKVILQWENLSDIVPLDTIEAKLHISDDNFNIKETLLINIELNTLKKSTGFKISETQLSNFSKDTEHLSISLHIVGSSDIALRFFEKYQHKNDYLVLI